MELGRGGGGERRKEGDVEEELLGFVHTAGDVHLIAKVVILEVSITLFLRRVRA